MRSDPGITIWIDYFNDHLSFEKDRKKLLPFAQLLFLEPEKLYAFLYFITRQPRISLVSHPQVITPLTAEEIIASHLFDRLTQYTYAFLHDEDSNPKKCISVFR